MSCMASLESCLKKGDKVKLIEMDLAQIESYIEEGELTNADVLELHSEASSLNTSCINDGAMSMEIANDIQNITGCSDNEAVAFAKRNGASIVSRMWSAYSDEIDELSEKLSEIASR